MQHTIVQAQRTLATRGKVHVVRNQHQCGLHFLVEGKQQITHSITSVIVKITRGLIGQQQLGAMHQCACNGHTLPLPTRQLGWTMAHAVGQTNAEQHVGYSLFGVVDSCHLQGQGHIVYSAQAGQQVKALEHDAHAVAPQVDQSIGIQLTKITAIHPHSARRRLLKPRQQQHERRFARTRWATDGHRAALLDLQIDALEDRHLALPHRVVEVELLHFNQGLGRIVHGHRSLV